MLIRYGVVLPLVCLAGFAFAAAPNETAVVEGGTGVSAIEGKVYESIDAQGNVDFSDEQPNGVPSKIIGIPQTNTFADPGAAATTGSGTAATGATTTDAAANEEQADGQDSADSYSNFAIVSPAVDESLSYGADGLRFAVATRPPLRGGHRIQYLIDGKVIGVPGSDPYLQVNNLIEGDHQIEARIVDMSGAVLQSTAVSRFNLNRTADGRYLYRYTGGNAQGVSATEGVRTTEGVRATEGVNVDDGATRRAIRRER
jgi:hypothetical protein